MTVASTCPSTSPNPWSVTSSASSRPPAPSASTPAKSARGVDDRANASERGNASEPGIDGVRGRSPRGYVMPGPKTNERPGTRAELHHVIVSPYKVREVLDLVRGLEVQRAQEVLKHCGRGSAPMIAKLLGSAVANASHNDGMDPDELYVSACFADE